MHPSESNCSRMEYDDRSQTQSARSTATASTAALGALPFDAVVCEWLRRANSLDANTRLAMMDRHMGALQRSLPDVPSKKSIFEEYSLWATELKTNATTELECVSNFVRCQWVVCGFAQTAVMELTVGRDATLLSGPSEIVRLLMAQHASLGTPLNPAKVWRTSEVEPIWSARGEFSLRGNADTDTTVLDTITLQGGTIRHIRRCILPPLDGAAHGIPMR
jgi:hypothetical protein